MLEIKPNYLIQQNSPDRPVDKRIFLQYPNTMAKFLKSLFTSQKPTFIFIFCILIMFGSAIAREACPPAKTEQYTGRTFPSLPSLYKENKFKQIEAAFEERSNLFLKGRHFHNYTPNKSNKVLSEEFKEIKKWPRHTWYSDETQDTLVSRSEFLVSQDLLDKGLYRRSHILAFDYNHSGCSYNSSNIILHGYRFLALEAPTNKNLDRFFKLLQNYHVTQLVRLTPQKEGKLEKSYPYWVGKIQFDPKSQTEYLNLPLEGTRQSMPVRYYSLENWLDHQGISPEVLLALIDKVRKATDYKNGLIACHCSGGVGRTGTFIAGYVLLEEIDKQLSEKYTFDTLDISIEKIVMQLSLQRPHMVATADQYITLHKLADLYIETLKKKKPV